MVFQLRVHPPSGKEDKIIDLCDNEDQMKKTTVQQLKQTINKKFMTDDNLQLVFGGKNLEDEALLGSYGIKHLSTIHTVLKLPGGI